MAGKVIFIGAGPGDPELITVKGWKALQTADVVFYDSLVDSALLEGLKGQLMYVGKRRGQHSMAQEEINRLLAQQARKGKVVVRLKGGDCSVLGRMGEELLHLVERGVAYEIIPGVTSATAAPVFAGIPITHRGLADSFVVVTAHRGTEEGPLSIPAYNEATTLVLMMALSTTETWRTQLLALGYPQDLPVAYVSSGTTPQQRVLVTTVGDSLKALKDSGLTSPALAVVGRVVRLRETLRWFETAQEPPREHLETCVEA